MSDPTPSPERRRWTFEEVWAAEFEPAYRAARQRLTEHRTEAFLDVALTLCGEPVRQMTPADMLQLDALGNVFIAGAPDGSVSFVDVVGLVWELHASNTHTSSLLNLLRRDRLTRRLAKLDLTSCVNECITFVDRMLLDPTRVTEPETDESRALSGESKTYFLAPLLANLAGDIGHIDPMSGALLAHTPLPRLLQYGAAKVAEKNSDRARDELDSLRNRCLARLNELNRQG